MVKKLSVALIVSFLMVALMGVTKQAQATLVDLTYTGASGSIGVGVFEQLNVQNGGTGVLDPFVKMQNNGTERGYNTDGRIKSQAPLNDLSAANWTHDLLLSELANNIVSVNSVSYYEFLLDIHENNSADGRYLSLDELRIYLSPTGDKTTETLPIQLGTLIYDIDAAGDSWVALNSELSPGSGVGDMRFLIPVSTFSNATNQNSNLTSDPYVYFYSQFGGNHTLNVTETYKVKGQDVTGPVNRSDWYADSTPEEWGERSDSIPEPATLTLLGLGLVGLIGLGRKKKI
jgi:hypothetical protein